MRLRAEERDPTYFRIGYMSVAQRLHLTDPPVTADAAPFKLSEEVDSIVAQVIGELSPDQTTPDSLVDDTEEPLRSLLAYRLIADVVTVLGRLRWVWVGCRPPWYLRNIGRHRFSQRHENLQVAQFLDRVLEPAAVVLYFSCLVEDGLLKEIPRSRVKPRRRPLRRPRHPIFATRGDAQIDDAWLLEYLLVLRRPPAQIDRRPWWHPRRIIRPLRRALGALGFVWLRDIPPTSYRTRYNLACFYSRLGSRLEEGSVDHEACLGESAAQLRFCLESLSGAQRLEIAKWAHLDPGLRHLREKGGDLFEAQLPAGAVKSVGER